MLDWLGFDHEKMPLCDVRSPSQLSKGVWSLLNPILPHHKASSFELSLHTNSLYNLVCWHIPQPTSQRHSGHCHHHCPHPVSSLTTESGQSEKIWNWTQASHKAGIKLSPGNVSWFGKSSSFTQLVLKWICKRITLGEHKNTDFQSRPGILIQLVWVVT